MGHREQYYGTRRDAERTFRYDTLAFKMDTLYLGHSNVQVHCVPPLSPFDPQRGKKRAREVSENVKRRHAKASRGGASRAESGRGKHGDVEAVTLFEVVTMGRSAMQVGCLSFHCECLH